MIGNFDLKKFETVLLLVLLCNFLVAASLTYITILKPFSLVLLILSLFLIIIWVWEIRNKDLTNLEILISIFVIGIIIQIGSVFLFVIGLAGAMVLGTPVEQFLLMLFFLFIISAMIIWSIVILSKATREKKESNIKINKFDILMIIIFFLLVLAIFIYCIS